MNINIDSAANILTQSEEKYRHIAENASDMIYRMLLPDGVYDYVSPSSVSITGYTPEEIYRDPLKIAKSIAPEWRGYFEEEWKKLLEGNPPSTYEYEIIHKSGERRWINQRHVVIRDSEGKPAAIEGIVTDITDHKRMEETLRKSLEDKDILLREIHHRVKNNLQIISSILSLQIDEKDSDCSHCLMYDTRQRIHAMARVHELLYSSSQFASLDISEYITSLVDDFRITYNSSSRRISINLSVEPVKFTIDKAIPLGLILNELISNAMKYAFTGRETGSVQVAFHSVPEGNYCLTVRDDGNGLKRDFSMESAAGLGFKMVKALSKQLGGKFTFESAQGSSFSVCF